MNNQVSDMSEKQAQLVGDEKVTGSSISGNSDPELGQSYIIDPKAERRLVWKFDLRILPVLAIMCMYCLVSLRSKYKQILTLLYRPLQLP